MKAVATGSGWYTLEDGERVQLNKKQFKASGHELVESFDDLAPDEAETGEAVGAEVPADAPPTGLTPEQISPPGTKHQRNFARQGNTYGPNEDYFFAATPFGEIGVPAGKTLEIVESEKAPKLPTGDDAEVGDTVMQVQGGEKEPELPNVWVVLTGKYITTSERKAANS